MQLAGVAGSLIAAAGLAYLGKPAGSRRSGESSGESSCISAAATANRDVPDASSALKPPRPPGRQPSRSKLGLQQPTTSDGAAPSAVPDHDTTSVSDQPIDLAPGDLVCLVGSDQAVLRVQLAGKGWELAPCPAAAAGTANGLVTIEAAFVLEARPAPTKGGSGAPRVVFRYGWHG